MPKKLLMVLLILVIFYPPVFAKNESSRLKELGKKVQAIDLKRRSEEQRVQDIDKNISAMQGEIASVRNEALVISEKIKELKAQISYYQRALAESQGTLRRKWVALYKGAYLDMADIVYTHAEYSGYIDAIISKNKDELMGYRKTREQLSVAKGRLDNASKAQKDNLNMLQGKVGSLNSEREKKSVLLASLRKEKQSYQEEIQRLLKELQARKTYAPNRGMAKKMGDLPWPVAGRIVQGFGISREKGYALISHGVDIEADEGAPVKTIHAGKIVFYNWVTNFGNTMIIDHGGSLYSVYGHLQKSLKSLGESVESREDVALVGQSGDVLRPTLHFEIRYNDKPQDPAKWLSRK
jgi:septal ring factor EnvC (AmiA/AmiB activator)